MLGGTCRDNHIMLQFLFITLAHAWFPGFSNLSSWNAEGLLWIFLFHAGVTESLYYWMHRAFHTGALYKKYHSFHHLSVVPEPPTGNSKLLSALKLLAKFLPRFSKFNPNVLYNVR